MSEATGERRSSTALDLTLARLEAKVDVALAQHGAKIDAHASQLGELRQRVQRVEDRPIASVEGVIDHEQRLRLVEARDTVSLRQLLAGLVAAVVAAVAVLTFVLSIVGPPPV